MEPDILIKLQKLDGYKEGRTVAMPMCSVCQFRKPGGCKIYGERPQDIMEKYKECNKAVLDKTSPFYIGDEVYYEGKTLKERFFFFTEFCE